MKQVAEAVKINAISILYSAARELVASVTGRGPFPAAILPSILVSSNLQPKRKQLSAIKKKAARKSVAKKAAKKGARKKATK